MSSIALLVDDAPRREELSAPAVEKPLLRLLVAMPALNEEKTVGEVIRAIPPEIPGIGTIDVLVVDDGSHDETSRVAREAGAHVLRHPQAQGVGATFHSALAHSIDHGFDFLVTIDSDGQFDPADIPALVAPVVAGEADFSSASRFKDPALVPDMPWVKKWGNRMMSRLISRLTGQKFYDVSCGMRCYSQRAALRLHLIGHFTYTQEVFLNLAFKNMRIVEVPIRVRGEREFGESRVASSLWRYALRTSQIILCSYRDYRPLRFFGTAALGLMTVGAVVGTFFLAHFLWIGRFSPHVWAGFTSATFFFLALLVLLIGMVADILNRHRIYLEESALPSAPGAPGKKSREGIKGRAGVTAGDAPMTPLGRKNAAAVGERSRAAASRLDALRERSEPSRRGSRGARTTACPFLRRGTGRPGDLWSRSRI